MKGFIPLSEILLRLLFGFVFFLLFLVFARSVVEVLIIFSFIRAAVCMEESDFFQEVDDFFEHEDGVRDYVIECTAM